MKTKKLKLLPCPFCGNLPIFHDNTDFYMVLCQSGNCPNPSTGTWPYEEQAIKFWNTRKKLNEIT